jgi:hypothetical protein
MNIQINTIIRRLSQLANEPAGYARLDESKRLECQLLILELAQLSQGAQ